MFEKVGLVPPRRIVAARISSVANSVSLKQNPGMRIEAIEQALHAEQFVPFRIVLPSDRSAQVPHPDFASIAPNRKWLLVWNKRGGWSLIEPALVVRLDFNSTQRR
jgi:hypothetical protein